MSKFEEEEDEDHPYLQESTLFSYCFEQSMCMNSNLIVNEIK